MSLRSSRFFLAFCVLTLLALVACGSSKSSGGFGSSGGSSGSSGDGGTFGQGGGGDGSAAPIPTVGDLSGKVVAPEGTIPISGALIYLVPAPPAAQPQQTFCDKCVTLSAATAYTYSASDGTFDLGAYVTGDQFLVVQKGQFRRIRAITVNGGTQSVDISMTTLPGKTDEANGDEIPRMAVVLAQWDAIEQSLAKLGIGTITQTSIFTAPTSDAFDITDETLLQDPTKLAKYNIVFIGCSFSSGTDCDTSQPSGDSTVQKNLQGFVNAGGKLYVTDYSYEFVRQVWPGFIDWDGEDSTLGSACQPGSYDATAIVNDKGLGDWLAADGDTSVTLEQSWTSITKVTPQAGTDPDGNPITITPKVWMNGDVSGTTKPMTVSFDNGCGRVLFSTYHTEGNGSSTLIPQEKALLYVLLEVGVCVGPLPPPK